MKYLALLCIAIWVSPSLNAQQSDPTPADLITMALERNPLMQEAALEVKKQSALKRSAFQVPKTDVSLMYGQYNSLQKNDNNISVMQTIPFPTVFGKRLALQGMLVKQAEIVGEVSRNELIFQVNEEVNHFFYLKGREELLLREDSLLSHLAKVADIQHKTGEGTLLGKTSAETQLAGIKNQIARNAADIRTSLRRIQLLCQAPEITGIAGTLEGNIGDAVVDTVAPVQNPSIALAKQNVVIAYQQKKVEVSQVLPDLHVGYFSQTLIGTQNVNGQEIFYGSDKRFQGFQIGLSIPLIFSPHTSRVRAAELAAETSYKRQEATELLVAEQYNTAIQELIKNRNSVQYLRSSALITADLMSLQSKKSFEHGELDYSVLLLNLRQALSIREEYLKALYDYGLSVITLEYLNGNQ